MQVISTVGNSEVRREPFNVPLRAVVDVAESKVLSLIADCDSALALITGAYPVSERDTWNIQRQEALAWQANNSAAVPFITALATERGVTVSDQAGRILAKVGAYQAAAAAAIGKRQRLVDQVDAIVADASLTDDAKRAAIDLVVW